MIASCKTKLPLDFGKDPMFLSVLEGLGFRVCSLVEVEGGEKLGVMQAEGLSGPLCWAVSMYEEGHCARIESVPALASLTEEELTAEAAWQRRSWLHLPQTATDAECAAAEA